MKNIILGVTGSVAATLIPKLENLLLDCGYNLEIVATKAGMYMMKGASDYHLLKSKVWLEKDEFTGEGYIKNQPIPHIDLRDWADAMLIAPLTANTLGIMANGLCPNFLTSIIRAWNLENPIIVAPAMNTKMWLHPATNNHLKTLSQWYDFHVIEPIEKKLACGEEGIGALANIEDITIRVKSIV